MEALGEAAEAVLLDPLQELPALMKGERPVGEKRVSPSPDIEPITIRDGREAELLVCTGDDAPSAELRVRIRETLVIPEQPWFSYGEQVYLNRSLAGHFAEQVDDRYYFVAIDEEIIGATWVGRGRNHPEIGSLGYVYSHPHFRRQGIATALMERACADFDQAGGKALYLATGNPGARRIYQRTG